MRFHRSLDDLLAPPSRLRVLRQLCRFPRRAFTGREVAEAAGLTPTAATTALQGLLATGVVQSQRAGRAELWQLSTTHAWVPGLKALFEQEVQDRDRLVRLLERRLEGVPIVRAMIFGSVARSQETARSDVDLFLEVADERSRAEVVRRTAPLVLEVSRRFGNSLSPLVLSSKEVQHPSNPPLVQEILEQGLELSPGGARG